MLGALLIRMFMSSWESCFGCHSLALTLRGIVDLNRSFIGFTMLNWDFVREEDLS